MAARDQRRPIYRRAILIYLVAIVGPALVLLYLGMQSVSRQRQAILGLRASNDQRLRLAGERLASEMEQEVARRAGAILREPAVQQVWTLAAPRERLERIRERHPVARHFFVIEGSGVRYPALQTPSRRPIGADLAGLGCWSEGEELEVRRQDPHGALAAYEQCYQGAVSEASKALALSRTARCLQKLKRWQQAEQAYQALSQRYGELSDDFHRPYGVFAALEQEEVVRAQGRTSPELLERLRQDLVRGRWELSGEQLDYYLERAGAKEETDYVRQFRFARGLESDFRHHGPLRVGEIYSSAVTRPEASYQIYYTGLPAGDGPQRLAGFAADPGWIESRLLPELRARLAIDAAVGARWSGGRWEAVVAAGGEPGAGSARRDALVFAGAVALILAVLVLGVVLLLRDVWRDLEWNRLRSDFVSGVSHELKTPLTLVRVYAEMLHDHRDLPDAERRSFSRVILRESDRLTRLIESVLDFSRIERGRKQYQMQESDLAAVVAGALDNYGDHLRRSGFTVQTELASGLPPMRLDPAAVSQAVVNLLDNAVKYSGDSTFVGVRLWASDGQVILEVEDRGIGIPTEAQESIFQQFYRAPNNAGKGGYGLGLYLVRHIMEAHGGSVGVRSEAGRGSRFRLAFPQQAAAT